MKYQFQFAGANVSRRSSQPRKRLRLVILGLAFVLAVLAYWQYLQHLSHGGRRIAANVEPAAATATAATAATAKAAEKTAKATAATATAETKTATQVTTATASQTTTDTKEITVAVAPQSTAESQAQTTATTIAPTTTDKSTETPTLVTANPATPAITTPTVQADAAPTIVPVMRVTSTPPPPRVKPRIRTPEERLELAGTAAFNNMLDLASKYPDSYGFRAQDAFADATLGKPIPVYYIDESDRAKYKLGQPVKKILKASDTWVFPVTVNDHVCCMVQVQYTGRDYVPGTASKLLGAAWDKITKKWPESEGYHPCVVVNSEIPGYYFTVPELPMQNMTDIVRLSSFHPSLSPADVILASWR